MGGLGLELSEFEGEVYLKMKKIVLLVLLMIMATSVSGDRVVKKQLGDLTGDGIKEVMIEEWSGGSAGESPIIKVFSGKRQVLGPIGFSAGTADGYKIVNKKIIVWRGNWNNADKWDPHIYEFTWYKWDKKSQKFIPEKEGFTKKAYTYQEAKKTMPKFVTQSKTNFILSKNPTFAADAITAAIKAFGKGLKLRRIEKELSCETPSCVHYFIVSIGSEEESYLVDVKIMENGSYDFSATQ